MAEDILELNYKTNIYPKVSIIIPNYNHEKFLKQRIESILSQTFQDFEIILLDDASTDDSVRCLDEYKNHPKVSHLVINKVNSGSPFKQWFKGLKLAKGDYIWIAESDDYASPLFLSNVMKAFDDVLNPDIVFVGTTNVNGNNEDIGNLTRIERKYKELLSTDFFVNGQDFLGKFMPNYCVIRNASSTVFKKSIITSNSQKVIDYKVIGDFYFWVNLCLHNYSFKYISKRLNFMRNHPNTVRRNKELIKEKEKEFRKIHKEVLLKSRLNIKLLLMKYYLRKII